MLCAHFKAARKCAWNASIDEPEVLDRIGVLEVHCPIAPNGIA